MKALVLCGGIPQIALITELKKRGICVVLADMNEKVEARKYADIFYPASVLDPVAVEEVAKKEKVDFIITVCADQVLEIAATVSEKLGLPTYIDADTAYKVSKKSSMKKIFKENGIPTSDYVILSEFKKEDVSHLKFPLIVKPVDSYSSRGVKRAEDHEELLNAFNASMQFSREKKVVVEEDSEKEIEMEGVVSAVLAGTMFRVKVASGHEFLSHISGKMRKRFIRLVVGDRVKIEVSPTI